MAAIGLKATFTGVDRVSGTVGKIQAKLLGLTKSAGAGLKRLDAINSKIAGGLKKAALAAGAIGAGVGLVAKSVIDTGAGFEQAITGVGAVGLQTRDQIASLEKEALRLGATTKFTATEAANAMEIMARAGFKNEEILAGVGGVLSAASASGLEMAEVANHVSNVLKGMGLAAGDAAKVADVLALASARTNSTIGSLGESMKNLAPVARQLNIPIEQAVASVALLQDVGLDASEAGTATATMLTKLANPSSAMAAEMRRLGIAFQDAKGNALGLPEILKNFDTASKKSGGNMKVLAFFSDLVGLRGQKAALNLKEVFASGKLSSLTDELNNAAGSAEKMATLKMDNLLGDWTLLTSAIDGVKASLFNLESGPLRGVVQRMTEWVNANGDLVKTKVFDFIEKVIPILDNFADGIKSGFEEVAPILKGVGSAVSSLFGNKSQSGRMEAFLWGETITKLAFGFAAYTVVVKAARVAVFAFEVVTKAARLATIAYNFVVVGTKNALIAYKVAVGVGSASTIAMSGVMTGATASAGTLTTATNAASASFGRMALTAGVAMAAVGALYAAYDQGDKLLKESGGWEGVGAMVAVGTSDWGFAGLDEMNNRKAKEARARESAKKSREAAASRTPEQQAAYQRAANYIDSLGMPKPGEYGYVPPNSGGFGTAPAATGTPPAIPPSQSLTPDQLSAAVAQELTIKLTADPGTSAEVVVKPKSAKVALQPSGAFD